MPFPAIYDVENPAGSLDDFCGGWPAGDHLVRIVEPNFVAHHGAHYSGLPWGTLFPALPSGLPNPGTVARGFDARDIARGGRVFRFGNGFLVTASGSIGAEMGPNHILRIKTTGAFVNLDMRTGGTHTHYEGDDLAAKATAVLRASGLANAAGFEVRHLGERTAARLGVAPHWGWQILNTLGNFEIEANAANSIMPTWGFTQASYSGAAFYDSETRPIHSEEWMVLDLYPAGSTTVAYARAGTTVLSRYRWLAIFDLNQSAITTADPGTAGDPKIDVYLSTSVAGLDLQPNGSYTAGITRFRLGSQIGVHEGTDAGLWMAAAAEAAFAIVPSRIWIVNLGAWRAATTPGTPCPDHRFVRIRIVDRFNPAGHSQLGFLAIGPGLTPNHNIREGGLEGTADRGGEARRGTGWSWDEGAPLSANHHLALEAAMGARRIYRTNAGGFQRSSSGHLIVPDRPQIMGRSRPLVMLDPTIAPSHAHVNTLYARGAMLARVEFGEPRRIGPDHYGRPLAAREA